MRDILGKPYRLQTLAVPKDAKGHIRYAIGHLHRTQVRIIGESIAPQPRHSVRHNICFISCSRWVTKEPCHVFVEQHTIIADVVRVVGIDSDTFLVGTT